MAVRATELPNPFTADVDVADTDAMVRLFGVSDGLLFSGFGGYPGLYSNECVDSMVRIARAVSTALLHPRGRIVFSGCGTSGRLSHCMARAMNGWLSRDFDVHEGRFDYLLAGSDAALLLPQESVEDRPDAGVLDLEAWEAAQPGLTPSDPVVVIGISCGLSATYVGSMLHAAVQRPGYTCVAVGFNPVDAVKAVGVDGWGMTFHSVLQAMLHGPHAGRCVVLNPVLGPETIAGSSRMKGGSGTKIVLETLCSMGVEAAHGSLRRHAHDSEALARHARDCLLQYEVAVRHVYSQPACTAGMAALIDAAAAALNTAVPQEAQAPPSSSTGGRFVSPTGKGRVLYLGVGTAGLLGLIDASECTPTYGSLFNDVRGFIRGGWGTMRNKQGAVSLPMPRHLRGDGGRATAGVTEEIALDLGSFTGDFQPTLTPGDLVVCLCVYEGGGPGDEEDVAAELREASAAMKQAQAAGASLARALVLPAGYRAGCPTAPLLSAVGELEAIAPRGVTLRLPALQLAFDLRHTQPAQAAESDSAGGAPSFLGELALKLVLNATTTGAHIRTGTIYTNRMVQVMLTNAKLFHRAVGIVADVTATTLPLAERSVLRAIYKRDESAGGDGPTDGAAAPGGAVPTLEALQSSVPVSAHVSAAATQKGIVPLAIMLALDAKARTAGSLSTPLTVAQAAQLLVAQPVVRKAIAAALDERK